MAKALNISLFTWDCLKKNTILSLMHLDKMANYGKEYVMICMNME